LAQFTPKEMNCDFPKRLSIGASLAQSWPFGYRSCALSCPYGVFISERNGIHTDVSRSRAKGGESLVSVCLPWAR